MEIRYCCKKMYEDVFWEEGEVLALLRREDLAYCPFCGAKVTETKCYKENKEEEI